MTAAATATTATVEAATIIRLLYPSRPRVKRQARKCSCLVRVKRPRAPSRGRTGIAPVSGRRYGLDNREAPSRRPLAPSRSHSSLAPFRCSAESVHSAGNLTYPLQKSGLMSANDALGFQAGTLEFLFEHSKGVPDSQVANGDALDGKATHNDEHVRAHSGYEQVSAETLFWSGIGKPNDPLLRLNRERYRSTPPGSAPFQVPALADPCSWCRSPGLVTSSRPCHPCHPCHPCLPRLFRVARRRSPRS